MLKRLEIKLDKPDYEESTSVASVFFNFTQRLIEWQNSLDILIEASNPALPGTPTWVPDWSRPYSREDVGEYKAASDSAPNFILGQHTLETSGKVLDEVDAYSHEPSGPPSEMEAKLNFKTKGGWNGVGPGSMRAGDTLVLISGLCVPMLLRKVGLGFEVVGLARVSGIMQGEAWPNDDPQLDRFTLV
jgi:hypothetical protein